MKIHETILMSLCMVTGENILDQANDSFSCCDDTDYKVESKDPDRSR
jgi:hypothetical protein